MAEKSDNSGVNLPVVALVALVAIVGLVALVMNAASVKQLATGGQLVAAKETTTPTENIAGNVYYVDGDYDRRYRIASDYIGQDSSYVSRTISCGESINDLNGRILYLGSAGGNEMYGYANLTTVLHSRYQPIQGRTDLNSGKLYDLSNYRAIVPGVTIKSASGYCVDFNGAISGTGTATFQVPVATN